jgi:hypothetical protein
MPSDALSGNSNLTSGYRSKSNDYGISVSSVLDKRPDELPNIMYAFRNGRTESVGNEDPTYFGFYIDIHSTESEAKGIENPFTGLRANPLFYFPDTEGNLNVDTGFMSTKNDGKQNFKSLASNPSEASAIQFLNHFGNETLEDEYEEIWSNSVPLKNRANSTLDGIKPDSSELNRGYYLAEFRNILNLILAKTPWVFKEIDGINSLWENSYKHNTTEATLTIKCEETVDLRITKLAHYYKMLSWDSFNNRRVLPHNLSQFSMDIYLMDLRFLKSSVDMGGINIGLGFGSNAMYDNSFSAQINFGGIGFRCMGCTFDFSGLLDSYSSGVKSNITDSSYQPSFKIKVKRVLPASYFGDQSFGYATLGEPNSFVTTALSSALNGALNLGPFTGGVTRVLTAAKNKLANILGTPQRLLNDALQGVQQNFEAGVNNFLGDNGLKISPYGSAVSVEDLVNGRRTSPLTGDIFPGSDSRTAPRITQDIFPGVDNRKANPIRRDEFTGVDNRTTDPIKTDMFPGKTVQQKSPIKMDVFTGSTKTEKGSIKFDVFPGDGSVSALVNQRKQGGKISSQNPYKS